MARQPARIDPRDFARLIPRDPTIYVQGTSAESIVLADAVAESEFDLGAATITGIFVPGLNRRSWLPNTKSRTLTFFMTAELQCCQATTDFRPLCYDDIRRLLRSTKIDAALFMVAPPDDDGFCSFGTAIDFLAEIWPQIPIRIAHINPSMPRSSGHRGIPFTDLTAWFEWDQALLESADAAPDAAAAAIAAHVETLVPDGATLQTGLGRLPGSILRALCHKRNLRIHSGLIGDPVLDLLEAGALAADRPATAGVAIGSQRLYQNLPSSGFIFAPVAVTHDVATISRLENFITINAAFSVDMFGQAYAELGPSGLTSGPGGASDFARGARAAGGLRIVVLASTAERGTKTRIVQPGSAGGPVSLGRMDIDMVITENGIADLRGLSHQKRAERLMAIAAPLHRDQLMREWRDLAAHF